MSLKSMTITEGLGEIKYGEAAYAEFDISDFIDRLHYFETSCGSCTTAIIDRITNRLKVSIDTTKVGATEGQLHMLHKTVTLHLDPEVPEFISAEDYKRTFNPDKSKVLCILTGHVQ